MSPSSSWAVGLSSQAPGSSLLQQCEVQKVGPLDRHENQGLLLGLAMSRSCGEAKAIMRPMAKWLQVTS